MPKARLLITILMLFSIVFHCEHTMLAAQQPLLKAGVTGPAVTKLQKDLTALGYRVPTTGKFGDQTRQALVRFQKDARLKADGVVGAATWRALEARLAAKARAQTPRPVATKDYKGIYIVQKGDTLRSIAQLLKVNHEDLASVNRMTLNHPLYIGQALTIPGATGVPVVPRIDPGTKQEKPQVSSATGHKGVAITFDDSPTAANLQPILGVLSHYSVSATFFLSLQTLKDNAETVKSMVLSGHTIENHGAPVTPGATESQIRDAIQEVSEIAEQITGRRTSFYRPQSFEHGPDICQAATLAGHKVAMWSNLGFPEDEEFLEATKRAVTQGAILRFSLGDPLVVRTLPSVIEYIHAQGLGVSALVDS